MKLPKYLREDKNYPFIVANKENNPAGYRAYVKRKRNTYILGRVWGMYGKIKPLLAFIAGIVATVIAQWIAKMLNLL